MAADDSPPPWALRPLPANVTVDEALNRRVGGLCAQLPGSLRQLTAELNAVRAMAEYDPAANAAAAAVWPQLDALLANPERTVR